MNLDRLIVILKRKYAARLSQSGRETAKWSPEDANNNAIIAGILRDLIETIKEYRQ